MWHGILTACLVCAPLVAINYFIVQVPQLVVLMVVMNFGVGITAGAACTWMMLRQSPGQRIGKLIQAGVLSGAIVVTVQYAVVPQTWGLGMIFGPFWGAILGSIGVPVLFMLQGPKRRKQDPKRRSEITKVLRRAGSSEEEDEEARSP